MFDLDGYGRGDGYKNIWSYKLNGLGFGRFDIFCLLRSNITSIMLRPIKQHNIMLEQAREKIIINGHCGPIDSL